MYFANDTANLNEILNAGSANIENKLKAIKSVNLAYDKWNESFVKQQTKVLEKIKTKLITTKELSNINGLEIATQAIDNPWNNDYNYMNEDGTTNLKNDPTPLTLLLAQNHVKNPTDFNNAWKPIIDLRETDFVKRLDNWATKNNLNINKTDNIFEFGEYKTVNWKISGLEIKSLSLPYYITSTGKNRADNTTASLAILEKLFVGNNVLFQYGKNYNDSYDNKKYQHPFIFLFNPDVYDKFINDDVTIQTIYEYVTDQTKKAGKDGDFIKDTDKVEWTSGGTTWLNGKINGNFIRKNGQKNFRLVINGNAFSMSLNSSGYTDANFGRSDTKVWSII
ncbi:hypothetical protein [Spiroplasma endosymbiont of Nebria brevicollis]|uniref:hypothetical protein n=1 Tax=Spiroplasma endosymbiont of Nebria brevicollis TaxID=3066284 RepID=UPI00313E0AEC